MKWSATILQLWHRQPPWCLWPVAGQVTRFDFQTLLLSLVSSFALFAVAASIVSFLAFRVVPQRNAYRRLYELEVSYISLETSIPYPFPPPFCSKQKSKGALHLC